MRNLIKVLAVIGLIALVAGCGARGPLQPPPGSSSDADADPPFVLDPVI